jgi:hypothetical protein
VYKNIDEAMLRLSDWKSNRRISVKPLSTNIAYKPTFEADYCREAAMYRFIELAESSFQLYNANLLIGAVVSARAAQETLAVIWFISSKLEYLAKTKDIAHFTEIMYRLILGWSNDSEFPEKINVFKCIDSVDKSLEGEFRKHYEELCEYAHPNYSGTFGAYAAPNHETLEVVFGDYPRSKKELKTYIESTLTICIFLLNSVQEEYEEVINSALNVCLELHQQGKLKEQMYKNLTSR